ncbi:hypothetical protein RCL_jg29657.t1 [Rhizophagus clarus]|uniref:Uncharacterized protein n=2 Tax=Rhizophagus clarus TaxID=94130 RepID=A0A8H3KY66_9GLOM|nr:hypothetical protein RCL_jg29657.t1 [Rhizophagus clarus]
MLNDNEWKLMKQLTKILQPFYDATKLLGGKEEEVKRNLYHLLHHYWENPAKEGMISALLDPRVKDLNFVSSLKKEGIISLLRDEYQFVKESEEFATSTTLNNDDLDLLESNNSIFIDMFTESQSAKNEINDYLSLQQLSPKTDSYK